MDDLETKKIGEGKPGPGRPKGMPNKTTSLLKDAILKAAEAAGNQLSEDSKGGMTAYLQEQAIKQPAAFMALLGKVLPMQVTGEDGAPLALITRIELIAPTNDDSKDTASA